MAHGVEAALGQLGLREYQLPFIWSRAQFVTAQFGDRGRIERHGAPRVVRLQSLKRPDAICRSTRGVANYFGEIACRSHCLLAGELVKVEP
jgi:hypothetical protein